MSSPGQPKVGASAGGSPKSSDRDRTSIVECQPNGAQKAGADSAKSSDSTSLHLLLFDDLNPTDSSSPTAASEAEAKISFDSVALWPGSVPSTAVAQKLLLGSEAPEAFRASVKQVLEALGPLERAALLGEVLPFDPAPLRQAVLVRWRLVAALQLQPAPGARIDTAALDLLVTEADSALSAVRAPADCYAEIKSGYDTARAALAREAVKLAEASRAFAHEAALEAADSSGRKYRHVSARLLSITGAKTVRTALSSKLLWIFFGISLVGTGLFHAIRLRTPPDPVLPNVVRVGAMSGIRAPSEKITVLQAPPDATIDPAEMEKLKAEAEAMGKEVHEVAPGQFIVAPVEIKFPEMPKGGPFAR